MRAFELYDATTIKEAVDLLKANSTKTARVVGGGSDLVGGMMKDWVHGKDLALPDVLVDITTIKDMVGISESGGGLTIGAATTLSDVIDHKTVQDKFGLLSQAALSVASPLIRNFGTLGGNINQRPRCWFFRGEDFNCYKKGGDFCYGVNGDKTVLFDEYFTGPRVDVLRENILKPGEFMTHVTIPAPASGTKFGWSKLKDRQVYDFALTSVAISFTLDGPNWKDGRVVLGGVSPVPYRAKVVEDALKGKDVKATAKAAAAQIRTVARPMSLNAYKVDVAAGLIERTLLDAMG